MPIPSFLSLALGMSFMAGLNLYLTTFLAGLAVHLGWGDAALYPALTVIGHPAVMFSAGLLFLAELVLDKIPWMDSVWDAVHTVIRPLGAVLLTLAVMSGATPALSTVAAVLAAGIAMSTHLTKSGLRLLLNASPEPFSNILASLAEDAAVAGLFLLSIHFPITGLAVCLSLLAVIWLTLPKMFRLVKASLYLMWRKLRAKGNSPGTARASLPVAITSSQHLRLAEVLGGCGGVEAVWAVPCITGKSRGFPGLRGNIFGTLVSPAGQPGTLIFLPRRIFRNAAVRLSLPGCGIGHESAFLSENLTLHNPADKQLAVFRFTRGEGPLAAGLAADLRERLGLTAPAAAATGSLPHGGGRLAGSSDSAGTRLPAAVESTRASMAAVP